MIKRFLCHVLLLHTLLWHAACTEEDPAPAVQVAVDGVLYLGQPVRDLSLWELTSLDQENPRPLQVDAVVIRSGSDDFFLSPQPGTPGVYYDSSGQLQLMPQQINQLLVVNGEELVISATQVPVPPQNFRVSQSQFAVNAADQQSDGAVVILWDNPDLNFFVGRLVLVTPPSDKINPEDPSRGNVEEVLDITVEGSYEIPFNNFKFYGTYALILYAINQEYAAFFGNPRSGSKIQQFTNIFNGVGIFTAASPDTLFFEIIPR